MGALCRRRRSRNRGRFSASARSSVPRTQPSERLLLGLFILQGGGPVGRSSATRWPAPRGDPPRTDRARSLRSTPERYLGRQRATRLLSSPSAKYKDPVPDLGPAACTMRRAEYPRALCYDVLLPLARARQLPPRGTSTIPSRSAAHTALAQGRPPRRAMKIDRAARQEMDTTCGGYTQHSPRARVAWWLQRKPRVLIVTISIPAARFSARR